MTVYRLLTAGTIEEKIYHRFVVCNGVLYVECNGKCSLFGEFTFSKPRLLKYIILFLIVSAWLLVGNNKAKQSTP